MFEKYAENINMLISNSSVIAHNSIRIETEPKTLTNLLNKNFKNTHFSDPHTYCI